MTTYDTPSLAAPRPWVRLALGVVFIAAGLLVLADVTIATVISAFVIGAIALVTGVFEIVHAFWTRGWGGFVWQILLGILYGAFGLVLLSQPVAGAIIMTLVLGFALFASGVVRMVMSLGRWREAGWMMLLSGLIGVIAGLIIVSGWPVTGLWVLGLLLAVDLISHGVAWLAYAWSPTARRA